MISILRISNLHYIINCVKMNLIMIWLVIILSFTDNLFPSNLGV